MPHDPPAARPHPSVHGRSEIIGLDLAKNVFQAQGAGADGSVIFRRKLSRAQILKFLGAQPRCIVEMDACASSHHWGRAIFEREDLVTLSPDYVRFLMQRFILDVHRGVSQ